MAKDNRVLSSVLSDKMIVDYLNESQDSDNSEHDTEDNLRNEGNFFTKEYLDIASMPIDFGFEEILEPMENDENVSQNEIITNNVFSSAAKPIFYATSQINTPIKRKGDNISSQQDHAEVIEDIFVEPMENDNYFSENVIVLNNFNVEKNSNCAAISLTSQTKPPIKRNDEKLSSQQDHVVGEEIFRESIEINTGEDTICSPTSPSIVEKKKTKKKLADPKSWLRNVRQKNHQSGKKYTNSRGKTVPSKVIKNIKNCLDKCKYKCSKYITMNEREAQHESYYSLTQNEKYLFITKTTERTTIKRKTINSEKRSFTFRYFFIVKGQRIQVCKPFYLSTLCISQSPVYNVHKNINMETDVPKPDGRGKLHFSTIKDEQKQFLNNHINSFPRVSSHYCRAKTSMEYLEAGLNVNKMYELYLEECINADTPAVKISYYRHVFTTEFNIGFHAPKTDRCDTCELYDNKRRNSQIISTEGEEAYNRHVQLKVSMREEKLKDKNGSVPLLIFDLENVITCPKAGVGSFFYKQKLNLYNLTAYFSTSKSKYCALWTETTAGRSGNDLASAVRKILDCVIQDNEIEELITWSDSCVPQNKNSMMSYAILDFLKENPQVKNITMKYSTAGHSGIQEVDNIHSQIEKEMKYKEYYSPLGFIKILKGSNKKNPFRIIQMQPDDFKDFGSCSKEFNYKLVPFSKVCYLKFDQSLFEIKFKENFTDDSTTINIKSNKFTRNSITLSQSAIKNIPKPMKIAAKGVLSDEKKKSIKEMMKHMPLIDQQYYKAILQI